MHAASFSMEKERVDAIFGLVPLDEALRWSLCWSSREAAGQRVAGWRDFRGLGALGLGSGLGLGPPFESGLGLGV